MKEDLVKAGREPMPVYLFTGFLESGKTTFLQKTLEDKRFQTGERTLLILCEEGLTAYEPARFRVKPVEMRTVPDEASFTRALLEQWEEETKCDRVMVEWNGMWLLDRLYAVMPEHWMVYQEFLFADARSFLMYNANMRQLVYDKLKSCELIVLNRFDRKTDVTPFHKIVRAANRRCDIAYEDPQGRVRYDDIVDPLPFDKSAPVVEIADRDYAIWYQDLNEELKSYDGLTVRFRAQVALDAGLDEGTIIVGRQMMNCCAADVAFAGLIAVDCLRGDLENGGWVLLTAKIRVQKHKGYDRPGPVLYLREIAPAEPPADEVATFY